MTSSQEQAEGVVHHSHAAHETHADHETHAPGDRDIAPIRPLPPPRAGAIVSAIVMLVALVGSVAIPGLIVSPTATTASGGKLGLCFGITMVGILITVVTGIYQYRKTADWVWFLVAAVPSMAVFCAGAIFAATKAVA